MPSKRHDLLIGGLLLAGSGIFFGMIPIFVAALSRAQVSPWVLIIDRLLVSSLIFAFILKVGMRRAIGLPQRDQMGYMLLNSLFMFFAFAGYTLSISAGTPPNKAVLIAYLSPLYAAVMGVIFLKEQLTRRKLLAIGVGALGIAITLEIWDIQGLNHFELRDIGAFLSGFSAAVITVLGRWGRAHKKIPALQLNLWGFVGALGWMALLGIGSTIAGTMGDVPHQITPIFSDGGLLLGLLGLAIFGTVIPYVGFYAGITHVPSSISGIFGLTEVAAVFLFSALFLGQPLRTAHVVGAVVIVLAGGLIAE